MAVWGDDGVELLLIDDDDIGEILLWYGNKRLSMKSDHNWRFIASSNDALVDVESDDAPISYRLF